MAKLFLMNLIVAASAFMLNYRALRFGNFVDSLSSFFTIYLAQIIATELILGIFGLLYLKNLILLNALILLVILYTSRGKELGLFRGIKDILLDLLKNKVVLLGVSLILGFGLVKVFINLINPPFGWDNLSYHFVFPVEWFKNGNLDTPITICDDPSPSYYPINASLFFLWFMLPSKNVFLADLGQLPFFVLAFTSIYSICRKLEIDKGLSICAASLFIITPNIFKQIEIAYVDVVVAGLFLSAVNFLIGFYKDFSLNNLILWSLSFAILLGTKTSAIIYGVFPCLFFIIILLRNIKKQNLNKILSSFALFIVITLAWGGFAYIRNFIYTGNILYPAEIKLLGRVIFKGVMPFASYRARWTESDFNLYKLLFCEGLGGQFIIFVIPAVILSVPAMFSQIKRQKRLEALFILSLPALLYASFLLFMPQFWVRYLYPFIGVGFIAAFYIYRMFGVPRKVLLFISALCFLGSSAELSGHGELAASFVLSVLIFASIKNILKIKLNFRLGVVIFIALFIILKYLNYDYNRNEFRRYISNSPFPTEDARAWAWLNSHTNGSRIAYAGIPHVLPLYGENFKNDVAYISVNKTQPAKLHYFPDARYIWDKDYLVFHKSLEKEKNYRQNADYSVWLGNLNSRHIDYLVVYSLHMIEDRIVFPIEDEWARYHPETFNLAYKSSTVHIYKLIR